MTLDVGIERDVAERFPDIRVSGLVLAGADRARWSSGRIEQLAAAARERLHHEGVDLQNLPSDPRIRPWREAAEQSGLRASRYKSSPEQLGRVYLRDRSVTAPVAAVNVYCALSAECLTPVGGYDVDALPHDQITLRHADSRDRFTPLTGEVSDMPLIDTVVVYGCGTEVLCWSFNHRDSWTTRLRPETARILFFAEAIAPPQYPGLDRVVGRLEEVFRAAGAVVGPAFRLDAAERRARICVPSC